MKAKKRMSLSNAYLRKDINTSLEQAREDLMDLKHDMSATQYQQGGNTSHEENDIAYLANQWKITGKIPSFLDRRLVMKIYQTISDEKMMSDKNIPAYAVPETLLDVMRKSLLKTVERKETNKQTIPALIVELSRNSLEVIKSTWDGFSRISLPAVVVRSSAVSDKDLFTLNQEKTTPLYHRIFLSQSIERDKSLEYQLMRDHEDSLMLLVRLPYGYRDTSAVLYQGKGEETRIIDSCRLNAEDTSLNFSKIGIGEYTLTFSGDIDFSMQIVISPRCLSAASNA